MKSNELGIIQGRLSPPLHGKIQAFPIDTWESEFALARDCGLDAMELVMDSYEWKTNPIWTDKGCQRIIELSQEAGIDVISIDPLYLTERGLLSNSAEISRERIDTMKKIIPNCSKIGMDYILMPIMINPSKDVTAMLKSDKNWPYVVDFLRSCLEIAEDYGIRFALETALDADEIFDLMDDLKSSSTGVCYDTGNSAYFGHDILADLEKLSQFLVEVHIKDVKNTDRNGNPVSFFNSVELGTGDVDFTAVFDLLNKIGFGGAYVLQMARGDDHVGVVKSALAYVKEFLN